MSRTPDVVFVVIDSARKDRVSAFGGDRETTPTFDRIASTATTYENALVPAPWTLPSHCSMFTGEYPSEHGITNGFTDRNLKLSSEIPTIAELLSEQGYATAGFSNNPWVGELSGLNRGFDRFVEWDLEITRDNGSSKTRSRDRLYSKFHTALGRAAGQPHVILKRRFFTSNLVERARQWIDETPEPSFTFMNLMEAHSPYYPPKSAFKKLGLETPGLIESRTLNTRLLGYVLGKADLSESLRERVMEYYDASVRYQDGQLEKLVADLKENDRFDDTMLVICADHGKTLGDYDRDSVPPHYTRDINIDVPLLIKWPNQRQGEHVESPVELADLFGVLRDVPEAGDDQKLPRREGGALVEDYVPHTGRDKADVVQWRCLVDQSKKYVHSEDGDEFLFERDTAETALDPPKKALDRYRHRFRERVQLLETQTEVSDQNEAADLSGAVEGQLEDLGYLN